MEKYGIKETKEVIDFGFALGAGIVAAKADGKIDLGDLPLVLPIFVSAAPALADISMVPKELADISAEEAEELVAYVAAKIPSITDRPKILKIVSCSLKFGLAAIALVVAIREPGVA